MDHSNLQEIINMQMRSIEIDIDVFRFLEGKRTSFGQSHNDILRDIAKLPKSAAHASHVATNDDGNAWSWKGVTLPHGTKLRMSYNGRTHAGEILNGAWHVGGAIYRTPSAAAGGVARSKQGRPVSLDGWEYWEIQLPGSNRWKRIDDLRDKAA